MLRRALTRVLSAAAFFPILQTAPASPLTLNGYSKTFALAERAVPIVGLPCPPVSWTAFDVLRLKLAWKPRESFSFNAAYGIAPRLANPAVIDAAGILADPRQYRVDDVRPRLYPWGADAGGHFTARHNLDRAYVRLSFDRADLFIGRQAIAWGSARVVNPTDVVAPYPFGELDTEERIGVDAVRAVIPMGGRVEFNAGYIAGRGAEMANSALFLRAKAGLAGTDATVCVTKYKRNLMAGLDLARSIAGAGAWLEAAYTRYGLGQDTAIGHESFRLSCGLDYRFTDKLYAFIEYHYNGDGESRPEKYGQSMLKPGYRDGPVYLMARQYAIPTASYQITTLFTSTTNPIINLNDGSVLLSQQFEYNTTQNTYLSLETYWGIGKPPAFSLQTMAPTPRTEFGSYPRSVFLSFRAYF
ncbi:MAG: hypothetical protein QME74_05010 [Candidatus Edwardsbacteria bacterium]|nr:hypothetical protein [Candidatus Edwardsbacteria bacterium]